MPVRSLQLGLVNTLLTAGLAVYTCPPGRTAIVKSVSAYSNYPIASQLDVSTRRAGESYPFWTPAPEDGVALYWSGWVVLEPGDSLWIAWPALLARVFVSASGAELAGVA